MQSLPLGSGEPMKVPFLRAFLCCIPQARCWFPASPPSSWQNHRWWPQKRNLEVETRSPPDASTTISSCTCVSKAEPARYLPSHLSQTSPGSLIWCHIRPSVPMLPAPPSLGWIPTVTGAGKPESWQQPLTAGVSAAGGLWASSARPSCRMSGATMCHHEELGGKNQLGEIW